MSRIGAREEGGWFLKGMALPWPSPNRGSAVKSTKTAKPPQTLHSKRQNNFHKLAE